MIKLTKKKLIEYLHQINIDPQIRERYNSKVNCMMNFLRKISGFNIAAVKEGG